MRQDPLVIQVMRAHKAALLAMESDKMQEMAGQWVRLERNLAGEISALAMEAERLRSQGQVLTQARLARMERYQRLLWAVRAETGDYVKWSAEAIAAYQSHLAELGITNAAEAIRAIYTDAGMVGAYFDILPVRAIETMIGMVGDGTPLANYLRQIHGECADGITQALIEGIAKGLNPTVVAEQMVDSLGIGLQTAMNTARTESLRAYREASLEQYRESGVVNGWKRLAAHDERTCPGCLFTEGQFYENEHDFEEHNQGRCTAVPCVIGVDEPTWQSGTDWFEEQSEDVQVGILGAERFEAWKNGTPLEDFVIHVEDPVWGGSFVPTPVGDL